MAWYSILPPHLIQVESWAVRIFVRLHSCLKAVFLDMQLVRHRRFFSLRSLTASLTQFLLGLITIVPWAVLIIVDAAIYLFRLLLWELPWIGGRARGQQRPRAPSLNERPGGQRRAFNLHGVETDSSDGSRDIAGTKDGDIPKENVVPVSNARAHSGADGELKLRVSEKT